MTQNSDFRLPFNSLTNYVPQYLRNPVATSLFDNLFNRFLTHDESVPLYGYVGRKPTSPDDRSPRVPQSSVERDINSVVPVFNFKVGAKREAFTVEDIIRKAEAIGISQGSLQWLYSQGNNYLPPINLDKFTNFFNYYWVAKALPSAPTLAWNPELLPEYYTIAAPLPGDLNKLNVVAATNNSRVLTGSGFNKLSFEVLFDTPTTYTVRAVGSLGVYEPVKTTPYTLSSTNDHVDFFVKNDAGNIVKLIEFDITREMQVDENNNPIGLTGFDVGDKFTISPEFLTRNYVVNFAGSPGVKGKIARVKPLSTYQKIDGVQLKPGDRVLIKNNSATDDGIYVVSAGKWERAVDFEDDTRVAGARVYVVGGATNGGKMFVSIAGAGGFGFQAEPVPPGGYQSNTNEWQEGNYWVSGEVLSELGLARADAVQAVRPIIEYSADVQLNAFVKNGKPSDSGVAYRQIKTEFDQLPMFDLFRYDGTHSGMASSVFYYEEDLTAPVDLKLQKRILQSTNDSADFVFNHGMADEDGQLLFVKRGSELKTIWHPGYTEATIVDSIFDGEGNGTLTGLSASGFTQQQVWTLTATSPTTFKVSASKTPVLPMYNVTATVNQRYRNGEIEFTIAAGDKPFQIGDTFTFRVGNLETPRYVYRNENDEIYDRFGGPAFDTFGEGAWQVPRTFYNNPYNESRAPVPEGVLYSHFRGILANQLPGKPVDYSFGGSIKLWSEQQTLLASLLMQRDMTPISIIDLAQRQYETSLNNVRDIYQSNIAQFIGTNGPVTDYNDLENLLSFVQSIRALDNDVRTVLYDSTSPVLGFPATLPQLGIMPLVKPSIEFDPVLGRMVLIHHDGHKSLPFENTTDLIESVLGDLTTLQIKRSDGTYTPAITRTVPTRPYKGELFQRADGVIFSFNVSFDTSVAPSGPKLGDIWFKRTEDKLFTWTTTGWVEGGSLNDRWAVVNFADTLNSLLLLVETRLYEGINPNARKYNFASVMSDLSFMDQLQKELYNYAAMNGYDPLGSDFNAADAFTWNYSSLTAEQLPVMADSVTPARWYNVLRSHQKAVPGVIPTERPNLEPWKLLGFATQVEWFSTLTTEQIATYTSQITPDMVDSTYTNLGAVTAVNTTEGITALSGLPIIDNVQLRAGDRVLLQNELAPANNGVWIVNSTGWTRVQASNTVHCFVTVSSGQHRGTVWALANTTNGNSFVQVRNWTNAMWADIQAARPTLKLSVDTYNDTLLPPFVNYAHPFIMNAITQDYPLSAAKAYAFGQGSPVETIWTRSLEYGYSLARALFRYDPLAFLGFCWGFNWVEKDGILYDGADMQMPGHKRFKLHGEPISPIARSALAVVGVGNAIATYDGYDVHEEDGVMVRAQNFTVKRDGDVIGYANVGKEGTFGGLTFTIKDEGRPFRIGDRFEIVNGTALFVPTATHKYLGFGQTFTNALRETSIDTQSSYAVAAFREWEVNMGYRAGGLVATDDLQVYTDSETLSESAFDLMFKKNQIARNEWVQALRITAIQFGETVKKEVGVAPKARGEDWVFRIEGYNPRYTNINYYNMSTAENPVDFTALSKAHTDLEWLQPTQITNVVSTNLPLTITGVQNVITFLFGYAKYLENRGWEFNKFGENNVDAETGRTRSFQLEIEKFVDRCYAGIELSQGHVVNPFIDRVWFNQKTGLLSEFIDTSLFDVTGHPGAFDALGIKFRKEDLDVVRTNEQSSFGAAAPMFSAHVQVDEFEHIFIFNNFSQPSTGSGLLYDPFSGARVVTYKFNGRKQATNTMRPEFGGHFLVGSEVHQNLQASTDNIANLYDANRAFENETTTRHALALLGFNRKQYFDDLDISEKTQFNFWRGLIQSKGTNLSIDAYLNNNRFDDAKIDEYWAYKLASYGDARQRAYPELKLSVNSALTQFTQIQFDALAGQELNGFDQVTHFDEARWFSIDDMDDVDVRFNAEEVGRIKFLHTDTQVGDIVDIPFVADQLVDPYPKLSSDSRRFTPINATSIRIDAFPVKMVRDTITNQDVPVIQDLTIVGYGPARPRFNPVKLFNYVDNELVAEIPMWHPAAGIHTPTAMEGINIISNINPARYNYSKQAANNNAYDPLRPWGANEVGRTWFDTRNLAYLPYYDKNIFGTDESLSRWGTLADYATIDVYEWVQSSVPPAEYDALAAEQAGDAGLDVLTKAAGQVADKQTYSRQRNWAMRPIAWSYSPVPTDVDWGATPPFAGGSTEANLKLEGGLAVLEQGTFAGYGITAGMRLGGWLNDEVNPAPVSEYLIENIFTKKIEITELGETTHPFTVEVEAMGGSPISGQIIFSNRLPTAEEVFDTNETQVTTYIRATEFASHVFADAVVTSSADGTATNATEDEVSMVVTSVGKRFVVELPAFGIRVIATATQDGTFPASSVANAIVDVLGASVELRDAVVITPIVESADTSFSNDLLRDVLDEDGNVIGVEVIPMDQRPTGWRVWTIPTQAQLSSDGQQPVSSWKPYYGAYAPIVGDSPEIQNAINYAKSPLTLRNGEIVQRYATDWSDWTVLKNVVMSYPQPKDDVSYIATRSNTSITFTADTKFDAKSTSVYVNGIAQLKASFTLSGKQLTVNNVSTESKVTVIVRKYEPSIAELGFDPAVKEDLSFQKQYKEDYEYVSLPIRDREGALSSAVYFFWVKNKTTPAAGKKQSVQSITQMLRDGPLNFLTFQHISDAAPYQYDAITISGLSYVVTKDDTFKLRFTRNFTLRDDPQELDLKNVHTEWALMRPGQKTRIPENLWIKLTDSVVGADAAGNTIPSVRRQLYDERNNTRTSYGFGSEQTLAPLELLRSSIVDTILNTKLVVDGVSVVVPDYISFLDLDESDSWFATAESARKTMTDIWNQASVAQVNEIFFAALNDVLASNYELSDIFKTSRISAYSIKVITGAPVAPTFE